MLRLNRPAPTALKLRGDPQTGYPYRGEKNSSSARGHKAAPNVMVKARRSGKTTDMFVLMSRSEVCDLYTWGLKLNRTRGNNPKHTSGCGLNRMNIY